MSEDTRLFGVETEDVFISLQGVDYSLAYGDNFEHLLDMIWEVPKAEVEELRKCVTELAMFIETEWFACQRKTMARGFYVSLMSSVVAIKAELDILKDAELEMQKVE